MGLKIQRIKRNLNQSELSQISGVGLNTIVKIEKGLIDGVRVGTLRKISNALNLDIKELFFSEGDDEYGNAGQASHNYSGV